MASESASTTTADSYLGSLISLTSKSEIRYEGVLYNINTQESSIGLENVRSFGTEGRKKDGPQVPPGDKIYKYILFRGSDIKDLQVKSSPPVQPVPPVNIDPAIIQSHYARPISTSTSLPPAVSGSLTDVSSHSAQLGLHGSNFPGGLPLYQPGGSIATWGATPPPSSANGGGLAMPMYWQGYYGPPNGLSHLHQQSLLRPPPGLPMPSSLQPPMQYPNFNVSLPSGSLNLPEVPSPLPPASSSSMYLSSSSLAPSTLPSTLPPVPSVTLASETLVNLVPNKASPSSSLPANALGSSMPSLAPLAMSSPDINAILPPISNKPSAIPSPILSYQASSQSTSSTVGISNTIHTEAPAPPLVTPGQLLQSVPSAVASSQTIQTDHKDVEVDQVSSSSSESIVPVPVPVPAEAQPPLLPLPVPLQTSQKRNGTPFQYRQGYRGRDRGRGSGSSRPVMKFTEEFDFIAMNEKFKKDEVWGHLGKSNKSHSRVGDVEVSDEDDTLDHEDAQLSFESVYNKDDFFDSLSCNALNHESQNGRSRFSEQMKIDTETFGDFTRYRGSRGGRVTGRGGRSRGGGYYGRGYNYVGRGWGRGISGPST